jgi:hypothetical protein
MLVWAFFVSSDSLRCHQPHVAVRRSQDGEARPVADGHHQHDAALHLDHGLRHRTALENAGRADGETQQPRGDRGELVGPVGGKALGDGQAETVGRDDDGVRHARRPADELRDQPVEPARLVTQVDHEPLLIKSIESIGSGEVTRSGEFAE